MAQRTAAPKVICPGCGVQVREDRLVTNPKVARQPVCPPCGSYVIRYR